MHENLLNTLLARLLSMVQAAPPSPDLGMRVTQTLLVVSQMPTPLSGCRTIATTLLDDVMDQVALSVSIMSEAELRYYTSCDEYEQNTGWCL